MQVRNELSNGAIDVRFREWHNGFFHTTESIDYMMVEEGVHHLAHGTVLQVARFPIAGTHRWKTLTFDESFAAHPSIFVMLQTARGADTATLRIRHIDATEFQVALFEKEKTFNSGHLEEEAAYFAFYHPQESGFIVANEAEVAYELQNFSINHKWTEVFGASIRVEEEKSKDKETRHGQEMVKTLQLGEQFFAQISSYNGPDTCSLRRR
jgi:hypothetical protein